MTFSLYHWFARRGRALRMVVCLSMLSGCQQKMASQPSYRPLQPSKFFVDGRASRPQVPGTVARGHGEASGLRTLHEGDWIRMAALTVSLPGDPLNAARLTTDWSLYEEALPMAINEALLKRGQERFNIYCAVCHDRTGSGKGMIVQRGFTAPPSFHTDLARGFKRRGVDLKLTDAPVGYYFEVISQGYGAMPDYAVQVEPADRWAIIAYIRALQLSQNARLSDVQDGQEKDRLLNQRGFTP